MRKRILYLLTLSVLFFALSMDSVFSQDIPNRPVPPRLVNDFAGLLRPEEVGALERKLDSFNDSTSTQIAIVIVKSLNGYDKADFAQQLGEKWGVGQKGKNNGVLILIKPKTPDSNGQVQLATGYGAEGVIPDLACADITDREILPSFRNGDYYGGLEKATNTLMSLARREFTAADYHGKAKKNGQTPIPFGLIIFIVFIIIAIISRNSGSSNNTHIGGKGSSLPFWMLMGMMNSGRGSSGSWGGFSGGGSGGGGGGFGGFGGGSFGGGGAGGSW